MRLSTGMYYKIAVDLISDRLDHLKFGLSISMQAPIQEMFQVSKRAERFRSPERVASGMSLFILHHVELDRRAPFVDECTYIGIPMIFVSTYEYILSSLYIHMGCFT